MVGMIVAEVLMSSSVSIMKLPKLDGLVLETGLSSLMVVVSWSQLLFWSLPSLLEPCSTLLPLHSPLEPCPRQALLRYWPKTRSLALPSSECLSVGEWKTHLLVPLAPADDLVLLLLLRQKLGGPVWHSGLSDFPAQRPFYPAGGRCVRNCHLLRNSLRDQNPEQVLTILGGSASTAVSMARTILPNEDKVGTSLVDTPTA
jgi:hypothetical protein